jgi:hypothetical protein
LRTAAAAGGRSTSPARPRVPDVVVVHPTTVEPHHCGRILLYIIYC